MPTAIFSHAFSVSPGTQSVRRRKILDLNADRIRTRPGCDSRGLQIGIKQVEMKGDWD